MDQGTSIHFRNEEGRIWKSIQVFWRNDSPKDSRRTVLGVYLKLDSAWLWLGRFVWPGQVHNSNSDGDDEMVFVFLGLRILDRNWLCYIWRALACGIQAKDSFVGSFQRVIKETNKSVARMRKEQRSQKRWPEGRRNYVDQCAKGIFFLWNWNCEKYEPLLTWWYEILEI